MEHRFVETNGIRLHCTVEGEGPLVLLLHGFPECWYSWRHQLSALGEHFRVVAPDLRGFGESDRPSAIASYAMKELVADVDGLIAAFGEESAAIVGHDWGGAIAWSFAMQRPQETRRLAVLNCPHPAIFARHLRTNPRQLLRSWYMFFFQVPWLPELLLGAGKAWAVGTIMRRTLVRRDALSDGDIEVLREAAARPGALTAMVNYYRAAFRGPEARSLWPPWLRRFIEGTEHREERPRQWPPISCPTLVIWGERDFALGRELTEGMEEFVRGPLEVRYLPGCSHWVQQEEPETVNQALREFLAAPDSSGAA